MKRKRSILTAIFCSAFSLVGCFGNGTATSERDLIAPWNSETRYEKSVYSITKFISDVNNANVEYIIADGELSYELTWDNNLTTLKMDFWLKYNDDTNTPIKDRNLKDSIQSNTTFRTISMTPETSERNVNMAVREGEKDKSHSIVTDYKNRISTLKENDGTTKTLQTPSSMLNVVDNEMLYYSIRSFRYLVLGKTIDFSLTVPFDNFFNNNEKFFTYNMNVFVDPNVSSIALNEQFRIDGLQVNEEDSVQYIDTLKSVLAIKSSTSGTSTVLYYAAKPIYVSQDKLYQIQGEAQTEDAAMQKVLISFENKQLINSKNFGIMRYNLKEYTINKQ
ncbi:MAG: hypothetical protein LBU60_03640 [Clostridiales bacterium]|jgi:hypothetical protein|nr:hypothetical protein [Clostridiales bacterium]